MRTEMDAQQDLLQAVEDFRRRLAVDDEDDEGPAGEYQAAEYIIFAFALDVYTRHLEETIEFYLQRKRDLLASIEQSPEYNSGDPAADAEHKRVEQEIAKLEQHAENPTDEVIKGGVALLRRLDRDLEAFEKFLSEHMPGKAHQTMLKRTLRRPARNSEGAGLRAQGLKDLLNLGGAKTIRGIFDVPRTRKQINEAITASKLADGDAALDLFAAMPVRNALIRKWLDWAADKAKPLMAEGVVTEKLVNPVQEAATEASDQAAEVLVQQAQQMGAQGADGAQEARDAQQAALTVVEQAAAQKAREALEKSGEPDEPPARSEVVGIATAAAVAALSDVSNPRNVPEPLKKLDEEQLAAALTDGKVLIAAGAGAGKSTTLVARTNYLIRDRKVDPERMLVTSFNTKAAEELKEKLNAAAGSAAPKHVGTMHKMFGSFVRKYGTDRERAAMGNYKKTESATTRAVQAIWKDCFPDEPTPSAKKMKLAKTQWAGNNVSPRDAIASAKKPEELQAAKWYEMYEGLKGSLDDVDSEGEVVNYWTPPCEAKAKAAVDEINQEKVDRWRSMGSNPRYEPKPVKTTFEAYMATNRRGGQRIADFDDMLKMCHDILERDPGARKAIQQRFDHIMVDECQDLNEVQHGIIRMMSEHITDGTDGKSLWMVGDDKQSIYAFRGARPDLFTELDGKEGWKTRVIRTNYRCAPEIVDHANRLIAHNEGQIPMEANASPGKATGVASIKVNVPSSEAEAAISTIEEIKLRARDLSEAEIDDFLKENAVLLRTNKEIHAYETACIIRGIPYARKGSGSFLGSRETGAMLGYMDLIMGGDDPKAMQKALAKCINEPNRFYSGSQTEAKTEEAIRKYAQRAGVYIKDVDPSKLILDRAFQQALAESFGGNSDWHARKAMEKIRALADSVQNIRRVINEPDFTTKDLFDSILGSFEGETDGTDDNGVPVKVKQSLRSALEVNIRDYSAAGDEADDEGDDEDDAGKLGNISFLYMLMEPDPTDPEDTIQSPMTPAGFKAKMGRLARRSEDLRYDLDWNPRTGDPNDKMAKLSAEERKKPPAVFLGTVHSVKGAEWPNTYVQMPAGIFPYEPPPPKEGDPEIDEEELKRRAEELETERRLAYVALTRAEEKLTVICPRKVGGRDTGISRFVGEAGLNLGENVPEAGLLVEPGVDTETKVATEHYIGQYAPPDELVPWDPSDFEGGQ